MLYNVNIKDDAYYPDIEADSPEQAKKIALEWFDERHHLVEIERSPTFDNIIDDIQLTDDIHSIITRCPHLDKNDCQECVKICPLAKVCYTYWTGED